MQRMLAFTRSGLASLFFNRRGLSLLPISFIGWLTAANPVVVHAQEPPVHTFSIVAYDAASGELGVAVQSKFFSVGTVVPWAKAKVGAIATQSYANVRYGPEGLELLASGKSAGETLAALTEADGRAAYRQVGIVDTRGNAAAFTGSKCHGWAGHHQGTAFTVQGNLLTGPEVVADMVSAFKKAQETPGTVLADWLMAALAAGQAAGGDKRGQQSAALLVVREGGGYEGVNDRFIDLRVEDHREPIVELARLLEIHKRFYGKAHQQSRNARAEKEAAPK